MYVPHVTMYMWQRHWFDHEDFVSQRFATLGAFQVLLERSQSQFVAQLWLPPLLDLRGEAESAKILRWNPLGPMGFGVFFRFGTLVLHCFVVVCKRGLMEGNGIQGILRLCFCRKDFGRLAFLTLRWGLILSACHSGLYPSPRGNSWCRGQPWSTLTAKSRCAAAVTH